MKFTVRKTNTLLESLLDYYHGTSRQKAKQILSHNSFSVNGKEIKKHPLFALNEGDVVEMLPIEKNKLKPERPTRNRPFSIYFEDDDLLVALKPAGILACGNKDEKVNRSYHKQLEEFLTERNETKTRLFIIHRIDREVEGLIMFAKTEKIRDLMKENWANVIKKYYALTENKPEKESGIIENWLKDSAEQKVVAYNREVNDSKFAKTEYRFLRSENNGHLLEITLHTGRKNQIRVHLSGISCPIIGDRKYGAKPHPVRQIRLAARYMEFMHPVENKRVVLEYMPDKKFFNPSQKNDENYKIM